MVTSFDCPPRSYWEIKSHFLLASTALVVLIAMGFAFMAQNAYATNYTLSDQVSCEGLPVTNGSAVWGQYTATVGYCNINGILTINSGNTLDITYPVYLQLTAVSRLNNFGTIDINGFLLPIESGSLINNNGTIINNNAFTPGPLINNGTITNNGGFWTDSVDNSGVINTLGYTVNNGIISNHGTLNVNGSWIYNYGLIKNYNTINNNAGRIDGTIDNFGTINNNCGGDIFSAVSGNQPVNLCPDYGVKMFQNGNRISNGQTIQFGQPLNVVGETNDTSTQYVQFFWIAPNGATVRQETKPISSPEDTFTPNQGGQWIIEVHFATSYVRQTVNVSFFVVPESPIGSVGTVVASVSVLAVFMFFRQHRNKTINRPF